MNSQIGVRKRIFDFIERLAVVAAKHNLRTIYFHNFARFDGIILLRYLVHHSTSYWIDPLLRNNKLYELAVYRGKQFLLSRLAWIHVQGIGSQPILLLLIQPPQALWELLATFLATILY